MSRETTRRLFAEIREDIFLAAKSRAAELQVPMRKFLEDALTDALDDTRAPRSDQQSPRSVWDDEYLSMQQRQPIGSPVELTQQEAAAIVLESAKDAERVNDMAAQW